MERDASPNRAAISAEHTMDALRAGPVEIPPSDLTIRFSRSSGPGGQNVNVRDTRVEIVFDLDGSEALTDRQKALVRSRLGTRVDARGRIRVTASAARTQAANRARALARLSELLTHALRPPPRPRGRTKPTRASKERRLASKRARAQVKRHRRPATGDE